MIGAGRLCTAALSGWLLVACGGADPSIEESGSRDAAAEPAGTVSGATEFAWFVDVSRELGIEFLHQDGRSGQRFYVETVASGGGWLDFDGDGDLDLYLINGAATPGSTLTTSPQNLLYENREGRFVDVTAVAAVGDPGYGMGMCAGDFDADGWLDFYVTNYGTDRLFRSLGEIDGRVRFEEVSGSAGVGGDRWGTNCTFADFDSDGDLDLYVVNYVDFSFERNPRCGDAARDVWSYCRPHVFDGQRDDLYINQGDGTFREESLVRGIAIGRDDRGFGVVASDLTTDGAVDVLVANDGTANRLYVNDGNGFFTEMALITGLALNHLGHEESGMGLALADVDGDRLQDLLVTNYSFETNTFYSNRDELFFEDRTTESGLGEASYLRVGWGAGFFDFDNDGDLDLAVANGHVMDTIDEFEHGIGYPQSNLLFENDGRGRFRDVSPQAGAAFAIRKVSRALAVGDWNDDGRLDLLITNTNDHVDLLENRLETGNHWIGFRLEGSSANPSAIGTRVLLTCDDVEIGQREVRSGGSLLAQDDLRVHFGLGACSGPVIVKISWPDGTTDTERFDEVDRYRRVRYPE
ncbi:MAG: CRTAC1 family protein [Thermoanaerobaculia bacterium]|nr:CRTAC1 family protein [Thermoanaerobaculia bacterium]